MNKESRGADKAEEITDRDNLPALIGGLGEDLVTLIDSKLGLLKIEIKEDIKASLRSSLFMGIGGVVALIGFSLLNIALAFLLSALFDQLRLSQPLKYGLGFILTGLLYLVIGSFIMVRAKNRMAKQNLSPEKSLEELKKDKDWLKEEF
jgi:uncharacterized membrane protein YqjE